VDFGEAYVRDDEEDSEWQEGVEEGADLPYIRIRLKEAFGEQVLM
jgi:hypothetical protein